ncbi:WecB/TagA/CpsF family glycosyltransferase [Micromonospora sp. WMMD812]|uniref:WecB/TagA/CpsF family glycosyltransferase n=1 Tax=Micromonospora sp. WMMD812 TaxID=3015152 RepID=UPI00248CC44F|nr:WecB/TagA/CpsF family glycosyltransferase [Micromonospora sp. WMMD812]WBB69607.1 WecB/TagA/CpsF family glycosyltransferase [Micromonospora sp. WMMD812]
MLADPPSVDFFSVPLNLDGSRQENRVDVYGIDFDPLQENDVIRHVVSELDAGRGGQIITPNVDILRRILRDPESRAHVESASLVVADGKPLIWASRIAGNPLPARVAGSDLIWSLSAALAERDRSIYLLGGAPGTANRAEEVMRARFPRLRIAGHLSPPFGFDTRPDQFEEACGTVAAARPDLVYVGLGFPKQERVIARLRSRLPASWFLGCGAAIGFVAGVHRRAPRWMQAYGLEWTHRLASEPARLMRRYLVHDLPFALELLAVSTRRRLRGARVGRVPRTADGPAAPRPAGVPLAADGPGHGLPIQTGDQV